MDGIWTCRIWTCRNVSTRPKQNIRQEIYKYSTYKYSTYKYKDKTYDSLVYQTPTPLHGFVVGAATERRNTCPHLEFLRKFDSGIELGNEEPGHPILTLPWHSDYIAFNCIQLRSFQEADTNWDSQEVTSGGRTKEIDRNEWKSRLPCEECQKSMYLVF